MTTSPVPLKVSFSGTNSVIANNAMKSMLRAVVDQFVKESADQIHYFPAYELVTQLIPNPFTIDGRHVKRETVDLIMDYFEESYVKQLDQTLMSLEELIGQQNKLPWSKLAQQLESLGIGSKIERRVFKLSRSLRQSLFFSNRVAEV